MPRTQNRGLKRTVCPYSSHCLQSTMPHDLRTQNVRVISCVYFINLRHNNSTRRKFAGEIRAQNAGGFFGERSVRPPEDPPILLRGLRHKLRAQNGNDLGNFGAKFATKNGCYFGQKIGDFWLKNL